ncbi:hypothetical protein Bca4012_021562 [Brassica carinata]
MSHHIAILSSHLSPVSAVHGFRERGCSIRHPFQCSESLTIFDKIISKEIPSTVVYEDDKVLVRGGLTGLSKAEERHIDILAFSRLKLILSVKGERSRDHRLYRNSVRFAYTSLLLISFAVLRCRFAFLFVFFKSAIAEEVEISRISKSDGSSSRGMLYISLYSIKQRHFPPSVEFSFILSLSIYRVL